MMPTRCLPMVVWVWLGWISLTASAQGVAVPGAMRPLDPYYPHRNYPKLITPQWVGDAGVECVVTLGIDDMRDPARYEVFLRPILDRLKKIDGRAPVSIMTCNVNPRDPQLASWLAEGLSLEIHTIDHPCPCLQAGDFARARSTYERCVDLLHEVPGNRPVAFRMPCCDSLNTPSPRFWSEIFNHRTSRGNFLAIDSSVFNIITADDPELPEAIRRNERGESRFRRYVPFPSFVNTIDDYPYPYVIGRLCWEFPGIAPTDWSAQHVQKPNNPDTVRDLKLALDAAVLKRGTFNLVFHPHGWIRNDQIVDIIDHAVATHGSKVKFLTFRECLDRLNRHLLNGRALRDSEGRDAGVQLVDANRDGYLDVVSEHPTAQFVRVWDPAGQRWTDGNFANWARDAERGLPTTGARVASDLNHDGHDELIVQHEGRAELFQRDETGTWRALPFTLPAGLLPLDAQGRDAGLRLVDLDGDRLVDVVFSSAERNAVYLMKNLQVGWTIKSFDEARSAANRTGPTIPPIVRADGTNGGAWTHSRTLWFQNEDTQRLPDHVDRVAFADMAKPARDQQARDGQLTPPKSPRDALASMSVRPGWKIELVAAEPLVEDPVAFDWAPDGSLWVAEMRDYPNGISWNKPGDTIGKPGGRVKRLFDDNGDGVFDRALLFLDNIPFPTGVKAWRDGVIVSTAPDVFFATDTDGDGQANERETLLAGFREGNQQHRVNGLRWGLDNWLYLANGDSGGTIQSTRTRETLNISGRDLRFLPDVGRMDAQSGQTQFGRNRDDWGNWFGGNNANPMWHYVLEDHYLRRNPHVPPPDVRKHVSVQPGASPVFPTSVTLARFNDFNMSNRFTSACSPEVFRDAWPGAADGDPAAHVFICEPVHNLVHHEVMTADGWSFTSRRPADEQTREFLSSSDNWFRPVMARTGPDGALWIADMYRAVIEHTEWIPLDWQRKLDLRAGTDKGRIYRVTPVDRAERRMVRLDKLDDTALVAALDAANGWQRDTVQQMILWRHGPSPSGKADAEVEGRRASVVNALQTLARDAARPQTRLHALCTLDGLRALTPELLAARIDDPHPGVRRHAVRLAEGLFANFSELAKKVAARVTDEDPQVRLQVAYSLGAWNDPASGLALAELVRRDGGNPYLLAAVMSSVRQENLPTMLTVVLRGEGQTSASRVSEPLLATAVALGDQKILQEAVVRLTEARDGNFASWQYHALAGLAQALQRHKLDLAHIGNEATRSATRRAFQAARSAARAERDLALPDRVAALQLIGWDVDQRASDRELLGSLLSPKHPQELQAAAVEVLGRMAEGEAAEQLLSGWSAHSPTTRGLILEALLNREASTVRLIDAMRRGDVPPAQLDARRRQQLLTHRNASIRSAAEKLFAASTDAGRQEVLRRYEQALRELKGDATRGHQVYLKRCANCHRLAGAGYAVGPDLGASTGKATDVLLTSLFDPSRAIEDRYLDYIVVTDDGRQLRGLLSAETGASITLLAQEGKTTTILRSQIEEMRSTGKSLMPEGLERELPPADVADLFAYLRQQAPPPKKFEGNEPTLVRAGEDGVLRLLATTARIYGPTLVFEQQYRNLGYWSNSDDHAIWTMEVPKAGKYQVTLDYASAEGAAGDNFVVTIGGQTLGGRVESTGSWDIYKSKGVGVVELSAGPAELTMRGAGKIKSALIDLRGLRLSPVP